MPNDDARTSKSPDRTSRSTSPARVVAKPIISIPVPRPGVSHWATRIRDAIKEQRNALKPQRRPIIFEFVCVGALLEALICEAPQ